MEDRSRETPEELIARLNTSVDNLELKVKDIVVDYTRMIKVLARIRNLGHTTHHAKGFSLADIAQEELMRLLRKKTDEH